MSAVNVVRLPQHKQVILAADAAAHNSDGVVERIASKLYDVQHWPGVITGTGQAIAADWIATFAAEAFQTFDEAVAGIETELPKIVERSGHDLHLDMVLAGWSHRRQRPESYNISTMDKVPPDMTPEQEVEARAAGLLIPYKLRDLPFQMSTPTTDIEMAIVSSFEGFNETDSPEQVVRMLRLTLEMQRRHADRLKRLHWVGGFGEVAIITPEGVDKQILVEWDEDELGEVIRPAPIDWNAFRLSIGLPAGMSLTEQQATRDKIASLDRALAFAERASVTPIGLSRRERRALKSQQRKAS